MTEIDTPSNLQYPLLADGLLRFPGGFQFMYISCVCVSKIISIQFCYILDIVGETTADCFVCMLKIELWSLHYIQQFCQVVKGKVYGQIWSYWNCLITRAIGTHTEVTTNN